MLKQTCYENNSEILLILSGLGAMKKIGLVMRCVTTGECMQAMRRELRVKALA